MAIDRANFRIEDYKLKFTDSPDYRWILYAPERKSPNHD